MGDDSTGHAGGTADGGTARQAAAARLPEQDALDALRWGWGEAYEFGEDEDCPWAQRRDGLGGKIRAGSADELLRKVFTDYNLKAVPPKSLPFSTAGIGVVASTGQPDNTVRRLAWEAAHPGGEVRFAGREWVPLLSGEPFPFPEGTRASWGDLKDAMNQLDAAERQGRCPVHGRPS